MLIKILLLLIFIEALALLGYYKYIAWETVIAISLVYLFIIGLSEELDEIKKKEKIKGFLAFKIDNIENLIAGAVLKIDSDSRIKEIVRKRRREVLEWLNKF